MPKTKPTQKLKVYSTPIGFHDAFVAAPSQKAALEAWGASTNLFSQGSAHVVTDAKLAKVPLQHPGQVIKVSRGSHAEQLAALSRQDRPRRKAEPDIEIVPKKPKKRPRKPSRAALTKAEERLEKLQSKQADEADRLEKRLKALEQEIRDTKRRNERERDEAQERVDEARAAYQDASDGYESG